jgi:hypothetical protein
MATLTAQILVGTGHPYHDGINPTHALYLSENDRPAWILVDAGVIPHEDQHRQRIVWIPSADHIVDDGLALIAAHVLRSKEVLRALGDPPPAGEPYALVEKFSDPELDAMREATREASFGNMKLVVTLLNESTINAHLETLASYPLESVVCAAGD